MYISQPSSTEKLRKAKPSVFVGSQEKASESRWDLRGVEGATEIQARVKWREIVGTRKEMGSKAFLGAHS